MEAFPAMPSPRKLRHKKLNPRRPDRPAVAEIPPALAPADLHAWAVRGLRALRVPPRDARTIAAALVQTSLWGIDSHGIARIGHYFNRLGNGSIRARPRIRVVRTGPGSARVDGGHGHGIVVCQRAMAEAIALARKSGVGAVGVANSSHCGAIGLYGRQAAAAGLVSIGFTHSDAFVVPHGGRQKFLGTNPICITIPTGDPARPLCLDMATSAVPYNRVVNYRREGRPLQPGWALDRHGRPTLDAQAAACLMPLAGHKGYGLAFMIDLLCGPLNGMPFGPHIPDMYVHLKRRRRLGSFFVALDTRRFAGGRRLPAVAGRMAKEARAQPLLAGAKEILAPGDPEYRTARRRAAGIPIEAGLWKEIASWSRRLGIGLPLLLLAVLTGGPAPARAQDSAAASPAVAGGPDRAALQALPAEQRSKLAALDQALADQNAAVIAARVDLFHAGFGETRDEPALRAKIEALKQAEIALANLRAGYFAQVAAEAGSLGLEQFGSLVQQGLHGGAAASARGAVRMGRFRQPTAFDFSDHAGFTRIFDGKTFQHWDGDPAVWHIEDGAIVGVSTKEKPVRNSYISYHGAVVRDFDLKLEIKILGPGGSGIQYRSAVNVPWRQKLNPGQPARNLAWMMTGPQADFWPVRPYSGQFYSENTDQGIVAWRGQLVNSFPGQAPRLVGSIGNLAELETYVRTNDWNQYEIIARGGTLIHLLNGQVMAVEIDDDPASSNNAAGLIGIELEGTPCQVFARNLWLRQLP